MFRITNIKVVVNYYDGLFMFNMSLKDNSFLYIFGRLGDCRMIISDDLSSSNGFIHKTDPFFIFLSSFVNFYSIFFN